MTDIESGKSRRSLALRRSEGSSALRPSSLGYIDFNGVNGEYLQHSRTPYATAVTSLWFTLRVKFDAMGVAQRLCGWSNDGAVVTMTSGNLLNIAVKSTTGTTIGGANSSAQVPAAAATAPIWLSIGVGISDAVCDYFYSTQQVDTYEEVTWVHLGTGQTGSNAGATLNVANSALVLVGNTNVSGVPSMTGNLYGFTEHNFAVKTLWFTNSDIPARPSTSFTSAFGTQLWSLPPSVSYTLFNQAGRFQGGLRSDFTFDAPATGLSTGVLMSVVDSGYSTVRVSYQPSLIPPHPTLGAFDEAMMVRSTAGFPATNLDGSVLMRHLTTDPILNNGYASVLDGYLSAGSWYYYSLFARYDNSSGWFKVGEQAWLNPGQYGYADRLWQGFPEYYRRIDSGGWGYPGVLRKLCDVIGYELDAHRTWASTVGDVWDFERLSAKLVPEAGGSLGLIQETANGDRRLRTLTGNLMALRKKKGTKDGLEGYIGALTGYPTRAYEGMNLLHRIQHSEWLYGFSATDGSGAPTSDNHPGWSSIHSGTTYGQLSRQVAGAGEGTAVGMPDGSFYLRILNNTGANSYMVMMYGPDGNSWHPYVPVVAGHQYKVSATMQCSTSSPGTVAAFEWINESNTQIGAQVTSSLGTVGTTWVRATCPAVTAPATAKFVRLFIYVGPSVPNGHTFNIHKPQLVDLAWRPEGIPSLVSNVPLSSALSGDIGTYVHKDYYEPPREVKVNVYPNRTNLALNSDFTLADTPAGAWSTFDAPTYAQLPVAYTDYADIIDAAPDWETSYSDMATGLYPLTGVPPTLIWDTAGSRLHINKTTSPYGWTLMHTYFPATDLGGMSAAVGAYSSVAGTKLTLAFEWYDAIGSSIKVGTIPVRHNSPEYSLTTVESRYEVVNAQPPANALYGRLLVMVSGPAAHDTSLTWALIEDAPYPEAYFNGDSNDGDDGDFFYAVGKGYTGTAHQSPSVYYQRFRRFASGVAGADALTTLMPLLLPFRRSFKVVTAATGLYNVAT